MSKTASKKQRQNAHERVRKLVAKKQRHPFGAAKCEFLLENLSREGVRNSHFVTIYFVSGHTYGFCEYIMITSYDKAEDECYEIMYMFGTGQQAVWEKKGCL